MHGNLFKDAVSLAMYRPLPKFSSYQLLKPEWKLYHYQTESNLHSLDRFHSIQAGSTHLLSTDSHAARLFGISATVRVGHRRVVHIEPVQHIRLSDQNIVELRHKLISNLQITVSFRMPFSDLHVDREAALQSLLLKSVDHSINPHTQMNSDLVIRQQVRNNSTHDQGH